MFEDLFEYMIDVTGKEQIFKEILDNRMKKNNSSDHNDVSNNHADIKIIHQNLGPIR